MRSKSLVLLFLFLAIASLLLAIAFQPRGKDDKWSTRTNQIDKTKEEAKARKLPHSTFQGELTAGNAWEDYDIALKDVGTWKGDDTGFIRYVNGDKGVDRAWVERFAAEHANALEHLKAGTRRADGQYPYNWDKGHRLQYPDLPAVRMLANFAAAQARILAEKGQGQEAASLLIDVTVLGRDVATNSPLRSKFSGLQVYVTAFDEMRHLLLSGKLSQAQLIELQEKLAVVERGLPSASSGFSHDMLLHEMQIREISERTLADPEWRTFVWRGHWRLAFSPKATGTQAMETKEDYIRRFEKIDNADFATARKELDAIEREVYSSEEELVTIGMPSVKRVFIAHHTVLTRVLLLQAAAGFLATSRVPTLRDPFGDKLLSEQKDGKTRIWSLGQDGTNQGGRGDWVKAEPDMVIDSLTEIPKE